ncbi:hypothetical protein ACFFQF_04620 [Haladaptatus pallidirubidus]|uniref:Uncharacterized protein n=1 Tax=Haladaptatus pallidirubidus TaxID=1008152 RepID=A0AAV3UL17_9EURY|nr:hypothetical protein [Haladaptatus pallidirubidus]
MTVPAYQLSDDGLGLGESETAEVTITTQYSSTTVYQVSVPQSLSQQSAVTV